MAEMRKRASGLIIPTSAEVHDKKPTYLCCLCDWVGYEDEHRAYQNHVLQHARAGDARKHSLHLAAPGLFDANFEGSDVEWGKWIDKKSKEDPHNAWEWMRTDAGKSGGGIGDG